MRAELRAVDEREVEIVLDRLRYLVGLAYLHRGIESSCDAAVDDLVRACVNRLLRRRGRVYLADASDIQPIIVLQERPHHGRLVFHRNYKRPHINRTSLLLFILTPICLLVNYTIPIRRCVDNHRQAATIHGQDFAPTREKSLWPPPRRCAEKRRCRKGLRRRLSSRRHRSRASSGRRDSEDQSKA